MCQKMKVRMQSKGLFLFFGNGLNVWKSGVPRPLVGGSGFRDPVVGEIVPGARRIAEWQGIYLSGMSLSICTEGFWMCFQERGSITCTHKGINSSRNSDWLDPKSIIYWTFEHLKSQAAWLSAIGEAADKCRADKGLPPLQVWTFECLSVWIFEHLKCLNLNISLERWDVSDIVWALCCGDIY